MSERTASGLIRRIGLCLISTVGVATTAVSAEYQCLGPVSGLVVSPSGVLSAESIAGIQWPYLCELSGTSASNTTQDTCKSIYALLLSAQTTGKSVRFWFNDSLSCSTHPAWATLSGWYWGPQLVD